MSLKLLCSCLLAAALAFAQPQANSQAVPQPTAPALPPQKPLEVLARVGVYSQTTISLAQVIQQVLANDRDIEVSRIAQQQAVYNVSGAKGYYDPVLGLNAYRLRSVTPIASLIGGAANGKLTQKELYADPQLSGAFPWLGGSYKLDFSSARQSTDSTFVTLNPQYPSALNLSLTQPLWAGLRFDANRHRIQVARKNLTLTEQQFRQRVIEVVTQAIQAYWELDFAYRNLAVQIEAVRLAEQQDASNRRQVEQGMLASVDVIQTQTQIATFQQNVFTAQENLTRAENALKAMILANRTDPIWGVALVPDTPLNPDVHPPALQDAMKHALLERPEIAESRIDIDVNRLDTRLSREQAKPKINAVAMLSAQGLAGRPLPPGPNPLTGNIGALVNQLNELSAAAGLPPVPPIDLGGGQVPGIFPGGYSQSLNNLARGTFPTAQVGVQISLPLRNRTALAQSAYSAAEGKLLMAQQQQIQMAIEADVRNTLQSIESARARLGSAVLARKSAEDQYASEKRQFQAGTSSVFLVLQRQTDLIAARSRQLRAEADLGKAQADLDRATARTIEAQNIQLASH
jgi:outer membrane protein TolC